MSVSSILSFAVRETNTKFVKTKKLTSVTGFDRNDFGMDPDPDIHPDLREEAKVRFLLAIVSFA